MQTDTPIRETSFKTYRISEGKIRIGQGAGTEEMDAISGFILGFDYTEGTSDEGEDYAAIRAELELKSGEKVKVRCKVGLTPSNSNVSAVGFALGLLQLQAGDDMGIFPSLSKPDPKYGKSSTFVDICKANPATGRYVDVNTREARNSYPGQTSKEKLPHILEDLKKHPLYRALGKAKEAAGTEYLEAIRDEKKWPDPFGDAKPAYLEIIGKAAGSAFADYADVPEATMQEFFAFYGKNKDKTPKKLEAFVEVYDPFKDE